MIHRYWEGGSPGYDVMSTAELEDQQGVIVMEHTRETIPEWIADEPDVEELRGSGPMHRANLTRYWALQQWGGVWLDMDVTPTQVLPPGCWVAKFLRVEISTMSFPDPGHPIFDALLADKHPIRYQSKYQSGSRAFEVEMDGHPDIGIMDGFYGRYATHLWWSSNRIRKYGRI